MKSTWLGVGLAAAVALFAGGCAQLPERSVSHESRYAAEIGTMYRTKVKLGAYGIRREISREAKTPDYVLVLALPGIGGPEVTDSGFIPAGTTMRIIGAVRRSPRLGSSVQYVVTLDPGVVPFADGREVRIGDAAAFHMYERPSDGAPRLNPALFERVED